MDSATLAGFLVVTVLHGAERLALIAAGGLSIWLGYRLFALMPGAERGEGKATLPGGVSIMISRVGPGVFFALFGCAILGYAVARPVTVELAAGAGPAASRASFSGFGQGLPVSGSPISGGGEAERAVLGLNNLLAQARPAMSIPVAAEAAEAVRAAKLALLLQSWSAGWGDRDAFVRWVSEGATGSGPREAAAGVMVFNNGVR